MLVDGGIGARLDRVPAEAKRGEERGYDAVWGAETTIDPFLALVLAAEHTERVQLGTSITVAFARSPMTLATTAWNLQAYSKGRLLLGLGSQIKAHIEKRFSMPWSHPAPRMREFISAMRAIWDSWQNGTKLDFRGDFYTHTLMTPFFNPGPIESGPPKVFLAAVGEGMTRVAAEVADGMLVHGFSTEQYLREVTLPQIEAGLAASGRSRQQFQLSYPIFVVTGGNDQEMQAAAEGTRKQIAFYGSTPAYRGVLEVHGWGDLQPELNQLSKRGEWDAMAKLIDDDVLDAFAVVAPPDQVAAGIKARVGDVVDRIHLYTPYAADRDRADDILAALKAA
ncbi:MAG: LLM class F420-dependent oxidoreductase [Acidimicrobiaceae bacterium]|nr:LLM class F420-dependent oxidoreductase [Acidimicrobiaceae bacterium]